MALSGQLDLPLIPAAEAQADLAQLAAESMGWLPLGEGAYLHVGNEAAPVITVVGLVDAGMKHETVLWLNPSGI